MSLFSNAELNFLRKYISEQWLDPLSLNDSYLNTPPFPHIHMVNFIKEDILSKVEQEFPDLSDPSRNAQSFNNEKEIKFASKGMADLSPSAFELVSFLNSDTFLKFLQAITGIKEKLISDPYLLGGGYHMIKRGGLLKVHADFNKHGSLNLDRRLNLLIYLNKDWQDDWGGTLQLFNEDMTGPVVSVLPRYNHAVIFSTTSFTYHGHPDALNCPENRVRKSLALYYFSTGRPKSETSTEVHSTVFKERAGEKFKSDEISIKEKIKSAIKNRLKAINPTN